MTENSRKLLMAARSCNLKLCDEMIRAHAEIDFNEPPYKRTPLWLAAWRGDEKICKLLIDKGATVNFQDADGRTPLHEAAICGHMSVVGFLLDKGAQINLRDNNGHTALHRAVEGKRDQIITFLVDKGAEMNLCDPMELTVAHLAAMKGMPNTAHTLFYRGAWRNRFSLQERKLADESKPRRVAEMEEVKRRQNELMKVQGNAVREARLRQSISLSLAQSMSLSQTLDVPTGNEESSTPPDGEASAEAAEEDSPKEVKVEEESSDG